MTSKLTRKTGGWVIGLAIALLIMLGLFATITPEVYGQCGNIPYGKWVSGETSGYNPVRQYYFSGNAGSRASIQMERGDYSNIDPYLELADPYGNIVAADDDSGGNGNSWINGYYLRSSGCYTIIAHSYQNSTYGTFWLYASW